MESCQHVNIGPVKYVYAYLTAPNKAASHPFFRTLQVVVVHNLIDKVSYRDRTHSTVSPGRAVPVFVNRSNPASKSWNSSLGRSDPKASSVLRAAYKSVNAFAIELKQNVHSIVYTYWDNLPTDPVCGNQPDLERFLSCCCKRTKSHGTAIIEKVA